MAAYIVADVTVRDREAYDRYIPTVADSVAAYGGRFLVRGGAATNFEGNWCPTRLIMIEFPTAERAQAWWASDEYAKPKAMRQANAHTELIIVQGVNDAPASE